MKNGQFIETHQDPHSQLAETRSWHQYSLNTERITPLAAPVAEIRACAASLCLHSPPLFRDECGGAVDAISKFHPRFVPLKKCYDTPKNEKVRLRSWKGGGSDLFWGCIYMGSIFGVYFDSFRT